MGYNNFFIGQKSSVYKIFLEEDVVLFSKISSDKNPIHLDKKYAGQTRFKQTIVQGPFVASLIGGILGSSLPGPGAIYIKQTTNFLKPVYIGDRISAHVMIIGIREDKPVITLRTWAEKENAELVIDGEAVIMFLNNI